jgi:hypothetical protein
MDLYKANMLQTFRLDKSENTPVTQSQSKEQPTTPAIEQICPTVAPQDSYRFHQRFMHQTEQYKDLPPAPPSPSPVQSCSAPPAYTPAMLPPLRSILQISIEQQQQKQQDLMHELRRLGK